MRLFQQLGIMVAGMFVVSAGLLAFFYFHAGEPPATGDFAANGDAPDQPSPEQPAAPESGTPDLPPLNHTADPLAVP